MEELFDAAGEGTSHLTLADASGLSPTEISAVGDSTRKLETICCEGSNK